ncbi:hypothetical protein C8F01DRAFT_1261146 [Mycena amicta]|nr:hypothetical protein C8F01DRAFT_1261146 [Mycena amicta]
MSLQFCLLHETPSQAVTPAQRRWNLVSVQVDIGSVDSLEEYLHRPGVVLYCREVLIPLCDIILVLDQHVTLSEAPMASPSWVRHRTAMFILLLSRVQDYVEPLRGAAPGSRVPTPSYAVWKYEAPCTSPSHLDVFDPTCSNGARPSHRRGNHPSPRFPPSTFISLATARVRAICVAFGIDNALIRRAPTVFSPARFACTHTTRDTTYSHATLNSAALDFIGKVILRYGLEGDHVPGVRLAADATLRSVIGHVSDVAWGMSARHAEISRTRASRSPLKAISLDPEIAGVHALIRSFSFAPSSSWNPPWWNIALSMPLPLRRNSSCALLLSVLASSYVNSPDGLGRFFQDFYRPLATALNTAFPGSAAFPTDVPVATREAMIPFVGKLFEWSIIAYQICTQIAAYSQTPLSAPSEIIFSLRLTQKFHLLCGCPNYGGSRGQEQEKHHCISHLTHLAQSSRTSSTDPIDYVERYGIHSPSTGSFLLPHVPCWTAEMIRTFLISEKNAPAVGEIELLEERIMECNRVGKDLGVILGGLPDSGVFGDVAY